MANFLGHQLLETLHCLFRPTTSCLFSVLLAMIDACCECGLAIATTAVIGILVGAAVVVVVQHRSHAERRVSASSEA